MARRLGALLLQTLARTGEAAATGYAQHQAESGSQDPQPTRRKKSGCQPCEAFKRVQKVRKKLGIATR